ncbi:MAG: hypothetical protein NTU88_09240, partial [Armatimonadetes bacterium]|nr:hypothetical protein [Armatimonadota bacterium]
MPTLRDRRPLSHRLPGDVDNELRNAFALTNLIGECELESIGPHLGTECEAASGREYSLDPVYLQWIEQYVAPVFTLVRGTVRPEPHSTEDASIVTLQSPTWLSVPKGCGLEDDSVSLEAEELS